VIELVGPVALLVNLAVWGAHAVLPFRLAAPIGEAEPARRLWALAALPALGLSVVVTAGALRLDPEPATAWRLHELAAGSRPALFVAVAGATLALADALLALGWRRFEPAAWRVLGALGLLGLGAVTLASELVRLGWGPVPAPAALWAAAALRLPLALAAGEAFLPPTRWSRWLGPAAAAALTLAVALWPAPVRAALGADRLTLFAAAALLLLARLLPVRFRRVARVAGVALAALFLARAGALSHRLGLTEQEILGPPTTLP
jgi:hypothetical protein